MKDKKKVHAPILVVLAVLCTLFTGTLTSFAKFDKTDPPSYHEVTLIHIPGWKQQCFDIAFASGHRFYLADATAKSIDVVNTISNKFIGRIGRGAFVGPAGCAQGDYTALGPDGVLVADGDLYAGDGNGTVKVFDLQSHRLVATIKTGGKKRADEMAYDAKDHLLLVTNPSETIPFVSFINPRTHRIVGRLAFPNAPQGLEQPAWDPATDMFYLSIPQAILPAARPGEAIDPSGVVAAFHYSATTPTQITYLKIPGCTPAGLALDMQARELAVGCSTGEQVLLSLHGTPGQILARIPVSGVDMVTYDPTTHRFFFAADGSIAIVDRDGLLLQSIPTVPGSHAVAVDPETGHVFVPESGLGILVYAKTTPA